MMEQRDRKHARRYDTTEGDRDYTDIIYSGEQPDRHALHERMRAIKKSYYPEEPAYRVFFGELHAHSNLSDGHPDPDTYYTSIRDRAKLDFGALSDHDHGGVAKAELWGKKWEMIRDAAKKYYDPHHFTTLLAYEKNAYPFYLNCVVYYNSHNGELLRGEYNGEMTKEELKSYLSRDDILLVPHDTCTLDAGTDYLSLDMDEMPTLTQVYSRHNYSERFDPAFLNLSDCEGGHWLDALGRGAKTGCIACSDDHDGSCGLTIPENGFPFQYPGITGVWAKENTVEGIFEALKSRRCFGFMGGRITVDFRINGHYMGEEITDEGDRGIYFQILPDTPLDYVTVVKNGRDYVTFRGKSEEFFFDYRAEQPTDYYYLRVVLRDGRMAWSSPIWITKKR